MDKSKQESITIVLPAKNEEGLIIDALESIKKKVKVPHQMIVVDGCSNDKTVSLVKNYMKKNKNVSILLTTPQTSGFKQSIDIGIKAAKTTFVIVMMTDLSDDPETINNMYKKALSGSDLVAGSRYIPGGGKIDEPRFQGSVSRIVSKSLHYLTGIPIHDVSNPFRLYRKSLLTGIKTKSKANEIPIEVMYRAYFKGAKIAEVPTVWRGRKIGKSKFKMLQVVPGYAKLYLWVLLNSWKFQLSKIV